MFVNGELTDMYRTDFLLAKEHNISLSEINEMFPYERKIYIAIIIDYLNTKAKKINR